jgi:hypothetical protein
MLEDHERASYDQLTRYGTGLYADVIQACDTVGARARFVHTCGTVPSVHVDLADYCGADIQAAGDLGLPWIREDLRGWSIAIWRTDISDPLAGQGLDVLYEITADHRVEVVSGAIRTAQAIAEIVDRRMRPGSTVRVVDGQVVDPGFIDPDVFAAITKAIDTRDRVQ